MSRDNMRRGNIALTIAYPFICDIYMFSFVDIYILRTIYIFNGILVYIKFIFFESAEGGRGGGGDMERISGLEWCISNISNSFINITKYHLGILLNHLEIFLINVYIYLIHLEIFLIQFQIFLNRTIFKNPKSFWNICK